ncbi:MAG: hypothetical protein K8T20_00375 [Planctomycetes bacterium]|nr:hypothetical protein [Planctomycetota bacterium]
MNPNRCLYCGSWFEETGYAFCPICGHVVASKAASVARPPSLRPHYHAEVEREASQDRTAAGLSIPIGILLGIAGPLLAIRVAGDMKPQVIGGLFLMFLLVAVFGANARASDEPARFVAGRVARTALITIAVCIAITAILAVVAFVLVFVACVTGKP